jgi:nitrogen fixation-related uncharacterized protein
MNNFIKENWPKLILPIAIILGCIIIGTFFYIVETKKLDQQQQQFQKEHQTRLRISD